MLGILKGLSSSAGSRLLSVLITFVSVPLTIGYLGVERYGAWVVVGAILTWIGLADLGLGSGLANALTRDVSRGRPDLLRIHISNFLFLMILIGVGTGSAIAVLWDFVPWQAVFGIQSPQVMAEVRLSLALAVLFFLARLPLAVTNRIYIAHQEGHIGNFWGAAGNVLALVALIVVTQTQGGLPWLVFAVSGVALMMEAASSVWLFASHKPSLRPSVRQVDCRLFGEIMNTGYQFFLLQIMALVVLQTDVLVISHFLGSVTVPTYSITYQLFNYALLPQTLLFPYLWSAYNEAITRGDIPWVRWALRFSLIACVSWSTLVSTALVVFAKPFIGWWAGQSVVPTTTLVLLMATWVFIASMVNLGACLLAAASRLRYQIIYSALSTAANLLLSVHFVSIYGIEGVIGATILSYLAFICGPMAVDVIYLLKRLERTDRCVSKDNYHP